MNQPSNKTKNEKKHLVPLALLFCATGISAQEFIYEPQYIKDYYSIVQETNHNEFLLYTNYYYGHSCFSKIDLTNPIVSIEKERLYVHDLKFIDEKYVFFCGESANKSDSIWHENPDIPGGGYWEPLYDTFAIFGYFDHSSFPFTTVMGIIFKQTNIQLSSLDKIDAYFLNEEIHVAMVGRDTHGDHHIIEAVSSSFYSNSWNFFITLPNGGELFDDVAVTDEGVVISSRIPGNDKRKASLYPAIRRFQKPSVGINTFLNHNIDAIKITGFYANDTVLIESCKNEYVAIATTDQASNNIVTSFFQYPLTHLFSVPIPPNYPDRNLRAIKYNPYMNTIEVLENATIGNFMGSAIYSVDNTYPLYGREYFKEVLFSLDYQNHNLSPGLIVVSGHQFIPIYPSSEARLYQYKTGFDGECSKQIDCIIPEHKHYYSQLDTIEFNSFNASAGEIPFEQNVYSGDYICK